MKINLHPKKWTRIDFGEWWLNPSVGYYTKKMIYTPKRWFSVHLLLCSFTLVFIYKAIAFYSLQFFYLELVYW
jgi:hypothetical protein